MEHKLCFGTGAMRHVTSAGPGGTRRSPTPGRSRGPDERITNAERMPGKALMPSARAKPGPITLFYNGLKEEVKDMLYDKDRLDTLDVYIAIAIRIDNR